MLEMDLEIGIFTSKRDDLPNLPNFFEEVIPAIRYCTVYKLLIFISQSHFTGWVGVPP